jgi:recombination protein RecT
MTSQEVVQRTPQEEVVAQLRSDEFKSQVALALPESVTPERFTRIAITALQANPSIAELERPSVMRALLQSAAMGLMPDGREAAIVPFKGKAQLIAMVGGLRKIAADYGWTIYTTVVHENDDFAYEQGLDVRFVHRPVRPGQPRGEVIAAYAVGKHADGRRELEVLTVEEVEKIRAVSQAGQKPEGPWVNWWEQMAEKSAAKRLFKKLPLSEDDKRVRIIRAAPDPADALVRMYGPGADRVLVDRSTGEIQSGADGSSSTEGSAPSAPTQQAEEAHRPSPDAGATAEASVGEASSVPDSDEEPSLEDEPDEDAGQATIPGGTHEGKTLAEIAAKGAKGEEWLGWASRHPESKFVGPELHAALQKFRPALFDADAS